MRSLSARLLLAVSILLLIALTLTAIILDGIFRNAAIEATTDRLNTQLILLMSSAEIDAEGRLLMPELLPEARFMTPGSGLLGYVNNTNGQQWKSDSAIGLNIPVDDSKVSAVYQSEGLSKIRMEQLEYFKSSMSVEWEVAENTYQTFIFTAAESLEPFNKQLGEFRTRLFSWFAFLIVCLLTAQALLMRWVLKPLRKIANEVSEIDKGQRETLSKDYPSELLGVTTNTNALIKAERSRLERYRNTLGNLAHSLKTPLAVIQTAADKKQPDSAVIQTQVNNMNDIVTYQLKRAATAGQVTLGRDPVEVQTVAEGIIGALNKVYFDKGVQITSNIDDGLLFYGDRGDLTEVLGNLLDNAFKWCFKQVIFSAEFLEEQQKRSGLRIVVEDDGKGIDESERSRILKRGQRADENTPGHGIGLAIIGEVVYSYSGNIEIEDSLLGGAKFTITLPQA